MTMSVFHCYCHASRLARRVLRDRPCRVDSTLLWALVTVVALAPVRVGVGMASPMPVLRAADPLAEDDAPDVGAVEVDPLASVASALEDCPSALSAAQRQTIARVIRDESDQHGYDPLFITALVQVESGCLPTARGNGALGLVQLLPSTARDVARRNGVRWQGERTLTEPASNIQLGLTYLDELEEQLGDSYRAVAAFNLGPARVAHMSSRSAQRTTYVRKVLARYEELLAQYA
jgi:soluble lytic murein transglycosylase-like protein